MNFMKCPFCGSSRLQTSGGESGDPFDRRPQKTVCLDCGRTVGGDENLLDLIEPVIVIEMTAQGGGITRKAKAEFPAKDGRHDLSGLDYPFCRYKTLKICGDTAVIDGEITLSVSDTPDEKVKHYTAFAPDKHPEEETVTIRVFSDMK